MAVLDLQNPAGLYTAGVVDLNPLPYMQMAERARARKEARQQAVDQYYQKLPETINEKGVRDQEIPVINEAKNQLQKYWIENKDAIRKGNTPEAYNYGKMIRDVSGIAQESKNRTATAVKLAQLRGNPKYDYIFRDPKLIDKIAKHEATIGTPKSEGIVFDQLTLPPAPFDRSKYINSIKIKPNPTDPVYKEIPGDKFKQLEITGKSFSPEDLNALHIAAQTELENNPSFEKEIKENIQANPEKAALMADIFQKNYGRQIKTEEDLAAAYTLSLMDLTPTQKTVPSGQAAFDYKRKAGMEDFKIKEGIRQAGRRELLGMREAAKQAGEEADNLWVDRYLDQTKNEAKASGKYQTYKPVGGKEFKGYVVQQDPVISKAVGFDDKNKGTILVTDDGKWVITHYKTDANYEPIIKDGGYVVEKSSVLNQDAVKLALGGKAGVKQLNKEMVKPSAKTKPKKDPLGLF